MIELITDEKSFYKYDKVSNPMFGKAYSIEILEK